MRSNERPGNTIRLTAAALLILLSLTARAEWQPDPDDKREVAAARALAVIKERVPRSRPFFDEAHGYAILPSVGRASAGFGGGYGRGLVIEGDRVVGTTSFWQLTSGIQGGASWFSMAIVFKDEQTLEEYKSGRLQFLGQAGLAVGPWGLAGTPAYNDGVAIFAVTRFGLIAEFTVSGAKFTFKPVRSSDAPEEMK
jgi:lipid-binding SYLF domain-containing protein